MKRILIITYYWPPSGGSGVQRWLKFAKYLPDLGWQPVIFTPANPGFQLRDHSLVKDIPPSAEVIKTPIREPYNLYKTWFPKKGSTSNVGLLGSGKGLFSRFANWVRGSFFIPDPRKSWVKPSVKFLSKYLEDHPVDVIITTGPPHSMHLIGLELRMNSDTPWIADFRDPWTKLDILSNFKLSRRASNLHLKMERSVLEKADVTLTVSDHWADDFRDLGAGRVEVVTNGFDEADFRPATTLPDKFRISHFGLLNEFRFYPDFWKVLEERCENDPGFREDLEIELVGPVSPSIKNELASYPILSKIIAFKGFKQHQEILDIYQKSAAFLLFLNNTEGAEGHIPGKIFEYMGASRTILAIGPTHGDVATILTNTGAGKIVGPDDPAGISEVIEKCYHDYKEGVIQKPVEISAFTRQNLTSQLQQLLSTL